MKFLGFNFKIEVIFKNFKIKKKKIKLGEYLEFSFLLEGVKKENLIIDYKIIYPQKNNRTGEKVFKLKKIKIKKGEKKEFFKKHLFRKMSTRKLYPGEYEIHIQINGKIIVKNNFYLEL